MTVTVTHKLGLTVEDATETADQVASLGGNYDIIDSKSPSQKYALLMNLTGFGAPGNGYEFDNPASGLSGWAQTSKNTGGVWDDMADVNMPLVMLTKVKVNDWIEINLSGLWNNSPSNGRMDVATSRYVGFDYFPINAFGTPPLALGAAGGDGIPSLRGEASEYTPMQAKILKQIVSGDLIDGTGAPNPAGDTVAIGFYMKTTGGYKFFFTTPEIPFSISIANLGQ